jgi:peptide/nickel transport system permease protein
MQQAGAFAEALDLTARSPDALLAEEEVRTHGQLALTWRRFRRHRVALVGLAVLAVMIGAAVAAPLVAPYNPNERNAQLARFGEPAPPSRAHPFGSDNLGRDYLSRTIYGARVSLVVGFVSTAFAIVVGTAVGATGGYVGRWLDMGLMRFADILLAFPPLLFLMAALSTFERRDAWALSLVIATISWMNVARLVRGEFLTLRTREYTEAARAVGASTPSIIVRELLPNAMGPLIVAATLAIPGAILLESTLSFLGFGIQPPTASWGNMLKGAWEPMRSYGAWWVGFFPGLMIALTVLSFNFVGDGLRDALDPRSRSE